MAKAVLVMDMPEFCSRCLFMANESGRPYCRIGDDGDCHCNVTGFGKPKWCPLIPEPERADENNPVYNLGNFASGWNACLDALEDNNETN